MKGIIWCVFALCWISGFSSGIPSYTLKELEKHFLESNYLLIAQKYQIDQAAALVVQEKVWSNPTLSISEVNLWNTGSSEQLPYLFGRFGNTQQISAELEQLIETAGKRKKRISIKKLEQNQAVWEYESLLLELKKELRQTYYELQKIHQSKEQFQKIIELFNQMYEQYERQSEKENIPKADFFRVQTERMRLQSEWAAIEEEELILIQKLQVFTNISDLKTDQVLFENKTTLQLSEKVPFALNQMIADQNPTLKKENNTTKLTQQKWELEKAQRTPDLTLQVNYDRGGNIMRDFVGIGFSIDLPVFNTNKAATKAARFAVEEQSLKFKVATSELEKETKRLRTQLIYYEKLLHQWENNPMNEQKELMNNYFKHLQNKQVTLLEFIDFVQAITEAQQVYFEMVQNYYRVFEELQFLAGMDFETIN
ncbi:MAG TPA: TolC family protein [Flavobacterium sp.]|nr:TolC family protein [Flavobacterium sp.]